MFDFEKFRAGEQVVNCQTQEDANKFIQWAKENGCSWREEGPGDQTEWRVYKEGTTYMMRDGHLFFFGPFHQQPGEKITFERSMME